MMLSPTKDAATVGREESEAEDLAEPDNNGAVE